MENINISGWFDTEKIDNETYVISEYRHWEETHCYLLNGTKRSLLIDTGLGISNIYDEVKRLTEKSVTAVVTHVHWDHIGGLKCFPEFGVHSAEMEWINGKFPLPEAAVKAMIMDRCELPVEFNIDKYTVFQGIPSKVLGDHDIIDIGGRRIEVIHTPGHSPGHMCFWEKERGYLFTGDLIYKGMLYADYPSTDPEAYLASLEKVEPLSVKKLFPGHHSMDIHPEIMSRMRKEFSRMKKEGRLCHGSGIYEFDDWSVKL